MKQIVSASLIALGLTALLLGLFWSSLFAASGDWSPEQNDQFTQLSSQMKNLRFKIVEAEGNPASPSAGKLDELKAEHAKLESEHAVLQQELESARDGPSATGNLLKWLGIAMTVLGGLSLLLAGKKD